MGFRKEKKISSDFTKMVLSLASPEDIQSNSCGEVTKHETVSYRTLKPERDGLYCERIFGPVKDFECHCGKYKGIKYKGITCDMCGVEITQKMVRRERMGHIALKIPVVHVWYSRSNPNKIAYLLGLQSKVLDSIIYYESYVVLQPGIFNAENVDSEGNENEILLSKNEIISNERFEEIESHLYEKYPENPQLDNSDPNKFIAKSGAEAIYDMLASLDLDALAEELHEKVETETSQQRKAEALKRLPVVEAFRKSKGINKPEYMILKNIPVIPPDLRPLMPLDGGRFATSDLNDLYIRVITRNNRLGRMIEADAPEVIKRNEKRMLQEAVDALFDNSRKAVAFKSDNGRALKSLSDSLKGKQGRFRQNLLGKRVDYSGRSVIVVGPELKMNECGLPKDMAAELYKPFIMAKLLDRGLAGSTKKAKEMVDFREDPMVWEILELVIKGHPVLLNRAPTLHRLGIQAFQPKLIEGKAIQLHPLVCAAFNADFDGDQMAVHLPLGNEAIAEAQLLMLASHNILNPASGEPITVPSQDMVLGLYYISKLRKLNEEEKAFAQAVAEKKALDHIFYSSQEAYIAYDNKKIDIHKPIKVYVPNAEIKDGKQVPGIVETSVGRLMFNDLVPNELGYINEVLGKASLKRIIKQVLTFGVARAAEFLDGVKNLGFRMAFVGGLSFNLQDVIIPEEKAGMIAKSVEEAEDFVAQCQFGNISPEVRHSKIVATWTKTTKDLTELVMKRFKEDQDGFNSIYMMLDSGARGSKEQIRQLAALRGLMMKPQKNANDGEAEIENPITSNFLEGLSVLEYFISTHGARKGLADTALKTADAGYLTRRLVDVSHDVVIVEEDCKSLRSVEISEVVDENDVVVASLGVRILGRTSAKNIYAPDDTLIIGEGEEILEKHLEAIENSGINKVHIRSVLTCDSRQGVCAKCYGRNLATNTPVQIGEVVGVIAAQSIGEPGTQLTLRTFHAGGVAAGANTNKEIIFRGAPEGIIRYSEEFRSVVRKKDNGETYPIVTSRGAEAVIFSKDESKELRRFSLYYGSKVFYKDGDLVKDGDKLFEWDAFQIENVAEKSGVVEFENLEEGNTYKVSVETAGGERIYTIVESKISPVLKIVDKNTGDLLCRYSLPINSTLEIDPQEVGQEVVVGQLLYRTPRRLASAGDITGGLPRVTELFEGRNPSFPAILSEIDGTVFISEKLKRKYREVSVKSMIGDGQFEKTYLIPQSVPLYVQTGDVVRAGMPLCEGAVTPAAILEIKGPIALQEYLINEVQAVYRKQNVVINDKHIEVVVRQMMRKVEILDSGHTNFIERQLVDKFDVLDANEKLADMLYIKNAGDSEKYKDKVGTLLTRIEVKDENDSLERQGKEVMSYETPRPASAKPVLQGITRAALQTTSFMSAASFQETTKVLNEAAINAKSDRLLGLKENVICGHLIPAGTGLRKFVDIKVDKYEEE